MADILRYSVGMPEGYRVIEVTTPVGTFSKRTAQPVAVVSVYRATKPFRTAGRMVKAGELFAVWHRTYKAAADAPATLFSDRRVLRRSRFCVSNRLGPYSATR